MSEPRSWPEGLEELTDESVEEFVAAYPLALVEVGAEWCPPCEQLEPRLAGLAEEFAGDVAFGRLDYDEHGDAMAEHRSSVSRALERLPAASAPVPALFLFEDGELAEKAVGAASEETLREWLEGYL